MRLISLLILCLVALLVFGFALLNSQPVSIDYYVGARELPLSVLLVITFVAGIIIGMGLLIPTQLQLKFEVRRHRHREG